MKETIAQEAKRLLEPIPDKNWLAGTYSDEKSRCCARGHWARLHSESPEDYTLFNCNDTLDSVELKFTKRGTFGDVADKFVRSKYPKVSEHGLVAVNDRGIGKYKQATPRLRVMALLNDMVEAGL